MQNLDSSELKVFVPAKDYEVSKQFYKKLGFKINWESDDLAEVQVGESKFLLQNYYQVEWAENFMFHLLVDNVDDWWQELNDLGILTQFEGVRANPPKPESWGQTVVYLWGPSGELWHISQPTEK